MIEKYLLYFTITVMLLAAAGVVTAKNVFHSAMFLGMALLSIAGVYLLLGAEFLAAVQVLVYIGGILTLIIFAIMFTKDLSDRTIRQTNEQKGSAFFISASILAIMVVCILKMPLPDKGPGVEVIGTAAIGRVLLREYVLPFEIVSVILLIALVGAIILARKETTNG